MLNRVMLYILGAICLYLFASGFLKDKAIDSLTIQNNTLQADLRAQITFQPKGKIVYKTRTLAGEVKTIIKYLPQEGSATVSQNADTGEIDLKVKNHGWTFRPLASGMIDNKGLSGGIGARLYFYERWGAGGIVSLSNNINEVKPKIFVDRRVDDFVPFLYNTSVGLQGGIDTLGIAVNAYL